ncbi:MAG: hypothetical protein PHS41_10020 [Victivallaceae bacterium]|nr:hypothetical protein [Victivallaceae bacterium]
MSIEVASSLIPGTTNTPLDSRSRAATVAAFGDIANPSLGSLVYCEADGHIYKIKSLKAKLIGSITVANSEIDQVERIPTLADLDGKAAASHTHTLSDLSNLSALSNTYSVVGHTHPFSAVTGRFLYFEIPTGDDSDRMTLEIDLADADDFSAAVRKTLTDCKVFNPADGEWIAAESCGIELYGSQARMPAVAGMTRCRYRWINGTGDASGWKSATI